MATLVVIWTVLLFHGLLHCFTNEFLRLRADLLELRRLDDVVDLEGDGDLYVGHARLIVEGVK